jgi:hypothetical protein
VPTGCGAVVTMPLLRRDAEVGHVAALRPLEHLATRRSRWPSPALSAGVVPGYRSPRAEAAMA